MLGLRVCGCQLADDASGPPGAAEMMMTGSPGDIDIILRGSCESIESAGGAIYNCSRGGSGFLETLRESVQGDKHLTHPVLFIS